MHNDLSNKKMMIKILLLAISTILLFLFFILKPNKIQLIKEPYIIIALVISLILVLSFGLFKSEGLKQYFNTYLQVVDFFYLLNLALFVIQVFFMIGYYPVEVDGPSMMPTLYNGEKLLVQSITEPENGDIIVLRIKDPHTGETLELVKRVIGIPGDSFYYDEESNLILNGEKVTEEYLLKDGDFITESNINTRTIPFNLRDVARIGSDYICGPTDECEIPSGYYFVMGDNRRVSHDSRSFGLVHKDEILGKIVLKRESFFKWVKIK